MNFPSDLEISPLSDSLAGKKLDVVVTGSIGAVESVRFIRSLRRLGAEVTAWLTQGGAKFITETALEWATTRSVMTEFSGTHSHLASGDACIVSPASANFIYKLANGITDTPASALCASYCGSQKPVMVLPLMHDSLFNAPGVQENLSKLKSWGVFLDSRTEEGKQKFPEPAVLADMVSHHLRTQSRHAVVAFGGTVGYIDDVRFIGNYSTGALGSLITEELYRQGFNVTAIKGTGQVPPKSYTNLKSALTNEDLKSSLNSSFEKDVDALIFLSAVLDYIPEEKRSGKIRSGEKNFNVPLKPTEKIISQFQPKTPIKVGFKLEPNLTDLNIKQLALDYITKYNLSMLVINAKDDVSQTEHKAVLCKKNMDKIDLEKQESKLELAQAIAKHTLNGVRLFYEDNN